jgi:hypothetical protein
MSGAEVVSEVTMTNSKAKVSTWTYFGERRVNDAFLVGVDDVRWGVRDKLVSLWV